MKVIIIPSKLNGVINAPPSKSYTHRAIILATLALGESQIKNALISGDTKATIDACRLFGAKITIGTGSLTITGTHGHFSKRKSPINIFCGLSGTTMRLMTAVATLAQNKVVIDGEKRLRERPMKDLLLALRKFGIEVKSMNKDTLLPIIVKGGKLKGGEMNLSGEASSQFISALLLISPFSEKDTTIVVDNLHSKPYVDITIDLMKTFGVEVKVKGNKYFIKSGQRYTSQNYTVEGDYSSASYFFAAAYLTNSKININNLRPESVQGDKYFLEILKKLNNTDSKRSFNLGNNPDIVPTVAICAAKVSGTTKITNIGHLRNKESDRIAAIENEMRKMGVNVKSSRDTLRIQGRALNTGNYKSVIINTYNDHRIAMSFAVAGLAAKGETIINNAEVVNKSYPNFWKDLQKVGAKIKIIN